VEKTSGKRKTMKQKKNEKSSDFKKRFNQIMASLNNGTYITTSTESIISIASNYINQKHLDGITSDRSYSRNLDTLSEIKKTCYEFCNKPIQKVSVSEIERSKEGMRDYSNNTISKIWALLVKTFKIAYSRRIIMYNIMEDETLTKPVSKKKNKKIESLSKEEEKNLEKILLSNSHRYNNILLLQLYTGMRIGEVLALSKDCVDLKNNTLTVYRTITRDLNDKVILGEHTKTYNKKTGVDNGKRTFPLTPKVKKILRQELGGKITNIYNLIFWDYQKNIFITDGELNSYLDRLNVKYHITERLHTHKLRHTFITRCQEARIPLVVIQALVGHIEGSSITNDVYTSVSVDFMKQELEKVK
jgi:integrase